MIFNHARFQIWNQSQHPFKHNLSDFSYGNVNLPGVTTLEGAMNWMIAVLYPQAKPSVATPAALPLVGNTVNDYRVVNDDGDGNAAGYRWERREGEATPSWHKILDIDWGTDSILQAWEARTQDMWVSRRGYNDKNENGTDVTGIKAGQNIYGGSTANTNLTLSANSGDGAGPNTGWVQVEDNFRPIVSGLDIGTNALKFRDIYISRRAYIDNLTLDSGSIVSASGSLSFGANNLLTTGDVNCANLVLSGNTIEGQTGSLSFTAASGSTFDGFVAATYINAVTAASSFYTGTTIADITFADGNIDSVSAALDFNALNLTTTGTVTGSDLRTPTGRFNGTTLEVLTANADLNLYANGTGFINTNQRLKALFGIDATGNSSVTNGSFTVSGTGALLNVDNLRLDGNILSSTDTNGNINLVPNGTGSVVTPSILPSNASRDLGDGTNFWRNLFISNQINNGTSVFSISELMTLKSANWRNTGRTLAVQPGDTLFWTGTEWLASAPDTEISHGSISGLTTGDAGHTQFALLAGRAGGQSLIGGTASGENLDLESTSNATKGFIQFKDGLRPFTNASFSGSWSGTDIGGASNRIRDVFSAGEFKGFRLENLGTLPGASAQNVGRMLYNTADANVYVDTGTTIKQVGSARIQVDTVWDGVITLLNVTVSGVDARTMIWQLKDNTNNFETMYISISQTSATNVRLQVGTPLPAGSYRLIGV